MKAIEGNVVLLSMNGNGSHVIQRCLQCFPDYQCHCIYEELIASCYEVCLSTHSDVDLYASTWLLCYATMFHIFAITLSNAVILFHLSVCELSYQPPFWKLRHSGTC